MNDNVGDNDDDDDQDDDNVDDDEDDDDTEWRLLDGRPRHQGRDQPSLPGSLSAREIVTVRNCQKI